MFKVSLKAIVRAITLSVLLISSGARAQNMCRSVFSRIAQNPREILPEEMEDTARAILANYKEKYAGRNILIFTDASWDQKSGVITVMKILRDKIKEQAGLNVIFVTPEDYKWHFNTGVQDVRVAYASKKEIEAQLKQYNPVAIHVMVEGTVGFKVKNYLKKAGLPFTSAYHTDFPKYLGDKIPFKRLGQFITKIAYGVLRSFHKDSRLIMAPTKTMGQILESNGFQQEKIASWSHGVEINKFDPKLRDENLFERILQERLAAETLKTTRTKIEHPISLFVGRIEQEKNLEDFLKMNVPGTKIFIGDGSMREQLQAKYPDAIFLGKMPYESLPEYYASADLFVMTSLTETFGLVMLEAAAAGTPVLAYNVQGPVDVMTDTRAGTLVPYVKGDQAQNIRNLEEGFKTAIKLNRQDVRQYAEHHPWEKSIIEFLYFLAPIDGKPGATADVVPGGI